MFVNLTHVRDFTDVSLRMSQKVLHSKDSFVLDRQTDRQVTGTSGCQVHWTWKDDDSDQVMFDKCIRVRKFAIRLFL